MAESHFTATDTFEKKIKKLASDHQLSLTATDSEIAVRRLEDSYQEILGKLVARGLTKTQVDTWARGAEFQLDIATFWYAKDSGWGGKLVDEEDWTTVFDRREELETISVLNSSGAELIKGAAVATGVDLLEINDNLGIER